MAEEPEIVVDLGRVPLDDAETSMGHQIRDGLTDGLDLLVGVDLLDHPSGMHAPEPVRIDESEEDRMEVR